MAETETAKIPTVMWAQRADIVYLTICLEDCKEPAINLDENKLTFSSKGGTNKELYKTTLEFHGEVNPQESKYAVNARNITFVIRKKESGPFWPQLLKGIKKAFWLKTDFNKWKDEDDSEGEEDSKNMDLSEMMQNMGGMGGMGGMPGMGGPGMGGMPPGMMGGMPPGMGGMPPGMEMPEDEEDSDDEDIPELE